MQNATGGFGGGQGQISHCAPTFATVLSLALVGGHDTFKIIDRKAMWVLSLTLLPHVELTGTHHLIIVIGGDGLAS
jgi:prenyltransferase beta subunit